MVEPATTWLGLEPAFFIGAAGVGWGLIGAALVWRSRSPRYAAPLALLLFTLPGLGAFILSPAIVLIVQNLG